MYVFILISCALVRLCDVGTPAYIARIKPGRLPLVLRNLHIPAIILNSIIMVLVMSALPLDAVLKADNVLSLLAEQVGSSSTCQSHCADSSPFSVVAVG